MYRFLQSGRWAIATVVVILVTGLFVNLGLWQLRRRDEVRVINAVGLESLDAQAEPLDGLLGGAGDDLGSLEWRRTSVRGTFLPDHEILVRSSVHDGEAGYEVITPLRTEAGSIVLIDRGWVPLAFDDPPVAAVPPDGVVEVEGHIRLSETRPPGGSVDAPPPNEIVARVDLVWSAGLLGQSPVPVWIQRSGTGDRLPIPADVPTFTDSGPHLSYAIQWFSFALISVVGFVMLIRSTARRGAGTK